MRPYNFGAGPATLPLEVLQRAQSELLDWQASGMSVMEMSHRDKRFIALMEQAEADLRDLLAIPNDYKVLFIGAPARFQFEMIAMNFLSEKGADYIVSGTWSKMAFKEAQTLGKARLAATNEADDYLKLPTNIALDADSDYVYFTPNETLTGLAFDREPETNGVPLIADMTSCLLSQPIDVSRYGLIFAGSQKNIAPAGLSVVIVQQALLANSNSGLSSFCDYKVHEKHGSNYATPPTFTVYMAAKVFQWLKQLGGVAAMADINRRKAKLLYDTIDSSDLFYCPVAEAERSIMNVAFRLKQPARESAFLQQAVAAGLLALKGHRSVGGMRASIYNAMPYQGVVSLTQFMRQFEMSGSSA